MNIHCRCSEKVAPKNVLNSGIAYNIQPFYCKESTDFLPLCFFNGNQRVQRILFNIENLKELHVQFLKHLSARYSAHPRIRFQVLMWLAYSLNPTLRQYTISYFLNLCYKVYLKLSFWENKEMLENLKSKIFLIDLFYRELML